MTAFKTSELAELLREHLKGRTLENFQASNSSINRAAYDVLHEVREWTELRRADMLCTAMGRPDYLQILTERKR